ncbi:MarR family winged helix-turn-helix transcriptional regulator [Chitinophaga ginsengisoli]|uniref:DNA-binding MarR family transcriptional regulator n=1 Tax=Chitinophaga ginsengisoli TaxID=363837 RepID=A0A2P8G7N3_9BACT|nr:MarR family transcriptional regulator [Chitinophaga ginsengisoli]PSL29992.1 DNA-binding MarR family transcriptional regulator [Chitinophaga ginsengisoli]
MSFYASLGYLVFGSRLRRLSEYFLMEVNKVYEQSGIAFDASWFPVFYILSQQQNIPLIDIAEQLEVSHSAVSQLITGLKKKGLVKTAPCPDDGRRQLVMLSKKGEELLQQVQPVWAAITEAMKELTDEHKQSRLLLEAVSQVESAVQETPLSMRILASMKN